MSIKKNFNERVHKINPDRNKLIFIRTSLIMKKYNSHI